MGAREDGGKELDRLFNRISDNPWRDRMKAFAPPNDGTDEAEAIGLADLLGDQQTTFPTGLVNGYFDSGPPDDTVTIDDAENDLPGWDFTAVAGTWGVMWVTSANGPAGYELQWTQTSANASDEAYIEQTIPVAAYRRFVTTVRHSADNANMGMKVAVAFLDETDVVIGSELSNTWSITTEQTSRFWREPPALAYSVRVRVGFVNAAGTAGQTGTILFITTEEPTVYSVTIPGVKSFLSPSASTDYMMPFPSDLIPNGVYKADTDGFVLGVSVKTDDTVTAGTISCRVENDTQATNPGPSASLSSGTSAATARQSLDGVADYDIAADDEIHLELSADGSLASSGGADYYGSARLLLVVNDAGEWA